MFFSLSVSHRVRFWFTQSLTLLSCTPSHTLIARMDHPPEVVALLEKYPVLRKAFETGVEVIFNPLSIYSQDSRKVNIAKNSLISPTMAVKRNYSPSSFRTPTLTIYEALPPRYSRPLTNSRPIMTSLSALVAIRRGFYPI